MTSFTAKVQDWFKGRVVTARTASLSKSMAEGIPFGPIKAAIPKRESKCSRVEMTETSPYLGASFRTK